MRELNLPMSSTLETFDDDYENENFHANLSLVKDRLKSIQINKNAANNDLSDLERDLDEKSSVLLIGESMTTSEFQVIGPQINLRHLRRKQIEDETSKQSSFNTLVNENDEEEENEEEEDRDEQIYLHDRNENYSPSNKRINQNDLRKIHNELMEIHQKIVNEYKIFQERQRNLINRELKLKQDEEEIKTLKNLLNFDENYADTKPCNESELANLKEELKEKNKEVKRLNDAFRTIKQTNEHLRQQINEKHEKMLKLEKQTASLNSRVTNLQKIHDMCACKLNRNDSQQALTNSHSESKQKASSSFKANVSQSSNKQSLNTNILESLFVSLDWLNSSCLKRNYNFNLPINNNVSLMEKSTKILPNLAEILIYMNANLSSTSGYLNLCIVSKNYTIFLEFIYWSLLHFDTTTQAQKVNLSATFRRIGEELCKSLFKPATSQNEMNESDKVNRSDFELKAKDRVLTCFIILRTLNQIDLLLNVFDQLKQLLKEDDFIKELFLLYFGTWSILKWCKLTNQILLNSAIDIYLLLSIESKYLDKFLESCSNELWFSNISIIFRNSNIVSNSSLAKSTCSSSSQNSVNLDIKIVEKLSVLLQKLSTIKSNKKYFEMFSLNKICTDFYQRFNHDNQFLAMNLKSLLFNLSNAR